MARLFAIVFFALAMGVTVTNREAFFGTARFEEGDDAANALQIHRAKHLQELHGNYSRYGFHHPGPAFFYVYAAGEWLLHDLTGIAPAPHNAHIYAATLLQLAFYAAAVALLAMRTRRPWVAVALALLAAAVHYRNVERPFYSVWPPDVLLMPFLCFLLAAAAVSRREWAVLPWFVLAACFLVHGHVAQPLFVVPITALTLWLAFRGTERGAFARVARSRPGIAAIALAALFVLPLGLDWLAGRESNVHDILIHLRFQTDDGQSLWQAFLAYAGHFIGVHDPSLFNEVGADSYTPFREHAGLIAGWLGLGAALAIWLYRRRRSPPTDEVLYARRVVVIWAAASLLNLVWGMRQDGGFTSFNSLFNHSLVHAVLLLGVAGIVAGIPKTSPGFDRFVAAVAVAVFVIVLPYQLRVGSRGDEVAARVRGILRVDPRPGALKLITMADAEKDWYEAVTLARALQRLGVAFRVHPTWEFMFGADVVFNDAAALGRGEVSIWHVVGRDRAPSGAHVLNRETAVLFPSAAATLGLPARLDFAANAHAPYPAYGIGTADEDWAWTEGQMAALMIGTPPATSDIALSVTASGFVTHLTPGGQRATLVVNGTPIGTPETFADADRTVRWIVPADVWNRMSPRTIAWNLPDAVSPAEAGRSGDRRKLGLRLHEMQLAPVHP